MASQSSPVHARRIAQHYRATHCSPASPRTTSLPDQSGHIAVPNRPSFPPTPAPEQSLHTPSHWFAVASSRLGRPIEQRLDWFQNLCQIALQARKLGAGFVTAPGTTADAWVKHAAKLFRIPLRQLATSDPPLRDQQLVTHASRVYALWVRPKGNVARALHRKIDDAPETVWVAVPTLARKAAALNPTAHPATASHDLLARGAVAWLIPTFEPTPNSTHHDRSTPHAHPASPACPTSQSSVQSPLAAKVPAAPAFANRHPHSVGTSRLPLVRSHALPVAIPQTFPRELQRGEWLIHATRARSGPLPGQSNQQWATEVLLGGHHGRPWDSADILREILRRGILRATQLRRGDPPVVCFSRQSLTQFLARRTFRAHRGRWDAEPFGIAIQTAALKRFGACPVHYGPDWKSANLPDAERWRFQPHGRQQQWREEQEWRVPRAIPLNQLTPDQAIVFVPDTKSALHVLPFSRWAVMLTTHIAYT